MRESRAMTLTFHLPKPPDNANGRKHWAVALKEKKRLWQELDARRYARMFPLPPLVAPEMVELAITWRAPRSQHWPDPDNAIRRMKPVVDWLVSHGYLAGDTAEHVRWVQPKYEKHDAKHAASPVMLTLTAA